MLWLNVIQIESCSCSEFFFLYYKKVGGMNKLKILYSLLVVCGIMIIVLFIKGINYKNGYDFAMNELNTLNSVEQTELADENEVIGTDTAQEVRETIETFTKNYFETVDSNPYVPLSKIQEYCSDDVLKSLLAESITVDEKDITDQQIKNIRKGEFDEADERSQIKSTVLLEDSHTVASVDGNKAEGMTFGTLKIYYEDKITYSKNILIQMKLEKESKWKIKKILYKQYF